MKNIAILVAPGFEEIELLAPLDILRRLNHKVTLAGVQGAQVTGAHNVTITTDTTMEQINPDELDALILPGGGGSWVLRDTPAVIELTRRVYAAGKTVAAICAAPIALAKADLVKGKRVTAYPMDEVHAELTAAGALIEPGAPVVVDGNLLTGYGPGAALDFGYAIGQVLGSAEQIEQLKAQMCYKG